VQITYDVETNNGIENRELPFVVGVLADLSGDAEKPKDKERVKDRSFINVTKDTFDDVLKAQAPELKFQANNVVADDGSKIPVSLKFESMQDFLPENVIAQVEPLRKLLEARSRLSDLRNKMAGNEKLEELMSEILSNTDKIAALSKQVGDRK
jgi:type VI secretion system protein ImpB